MCVSLSGQYDHFRADGCRVFPDAVANHRAPPRPVGWAAEERAARRDAMGLVHDARQGLQGLGLFGLMRRCPFCGHQNLKGADGSNHHRCENCAAAFCFLCGGDLRRGTRGHFRPSHPQHGQPS